MSTQGSSGTGGRFSGYYRWLYRNGRPNHLAQLMNRLGAIAFSTGLSSHVARAHWKWSVAVPAA